MTSKSLIDGGSILNMKRNFSPQPCDSIEHKGVVQKHSIYKYAAPEKEKVNVKVRLSDKKIQQITQICELCGNEAGELINILHQTQQLLGYLPAEVQEVIAHELKVSTAHVYGVVTFYSYFSMVPKGRFPISICTGTACYVRGAEKVLEEFKRQLNIKSGRNHRGH